jgi:hypothetical protein
VAAHFEGPLELIPPQVVVDESGYAGVLWVIKELENNYGIIFSEMGSHANLLTNWGDRDWGYLGSTDTLLSALHRFNCNPHCRLVGEARVIHCTLGNKKFDLCLMDMGVGGTPIHITNFGGLCASFFATAISTLPHYYDLFNACRLLLGAACGSDLSKLGTGDGQISSTAVGLLLLSHRKFCTSRDGPPPPFVMPGQGSPTRGEGKETFGGLLMSFLQYIEHLLTLSNGDIDIYASGGGSELFPVHGFIRDYPCPKGRTCKLRLELSFSHQERHFISVHKFDEGGKFLARAIRILCNV